MISQHAHNRSQRRPHPVPTNAMLHPGHPRLHEPILRAISKTIGGAHHWQSIPAPNKGNVWKHPTNAALLGMSEMIPPYRILLVGRSLVTGALCVPGVEYPPTAFIRNDLVCRATSSRPELAVISEFEVTKLGEDHYEITYGKCVFCFRLKRTIVGTCGTVGVKSTFKDGVLGPLVHTTGQEIEYRPLNIDFRPALKPYCIPLDHTVPFAFAHTAPIARDSANASRTTTVLLPARERVPSYKRQLTTGSPSPARTFPDDSDSEYESGPSGRVAKRPRRSPKAKTDIEVDGSNLGAAVPVAPKLSVLDETGSSAAYAQRASIFETTDAIALASIIEQQAPAAAAAEAEVPLDFDDESDEIRLMMMMFNSGPSVEPTAAEDDMVYKSVDELEAENVALKQQVQTLEQRLDKSTSCFKQLFTSKQKSDLRIHEFRTLTKRHFPELAKWRDHDFGVPDKAPIVITVEEEARWKAIKEAMRAGGAGA